MPIHSKSIGILGGGQLARMLALKAKQMGLSVTILSEKAEDPAVSVASSWIQGSLASLADLNRLINHVDFVTFESEFISARLLESAFSRTRKNKIAPSLDILAKMQDRLLQKEWLYDYDLPTLDYVKISSKDDLELAFKAFNGRIVCKRRFGGYDGYGTYVIKSKLELLEFKIRFKGQENQFIAERFIAFKSERSLLFARNQNAEMIHFPLVQSVQKNNQCDYVVGPTLHSKQAKLISKINKFLNEINYVGVIAFELFDLGSKLFINEIAPRVHNTGHFSQDALNVDQFELHLRCVLGLNLPPVRLKQPAFVMVNLLGNSTQAPVIRKMPTGSMHWYDKTENRPRRKMGHINYIGKNKKSLLKKALLERKGIEL